jgi:N-acetylglucosamine-6-phosphate deacetylase
LFDLQVNGYAGIDFQQDNLTVEDLLAASHALGQAGCTRFFIALITNEWEVLMQRLKKLRHLRSQSPALQAAIAGWHIEGPFLSAEPGFHGAHAPQFMRDPAPEHILQLRQIAGNEPVLLTLAPERQGAFAAIKLAVENRMVVSLGHTDASAALISQAVAHGARAFTHLGNGCPRSLDRHDNILWRVFEAQGLFVSLIPDNIHVSPSLFRLIHRTLNPDLIYYTTDAMSAAGAPPGRYKLGKLELDVGPDQVVRQPGKPLFAGSALRPVDGVFRAAEMLGCSWRETWARLSVVPAKLVGLSHHLAVGQPATFCLLRLGEQNQLLDLQVCALHGLDS